MLANGQGTPRDDRVAEQAKSASYGPADYLLDDAFFFKFNGAAAFAAALDRNAIAPSEMADALLVLVSQIENAEASDDALILRFDNGAQLKYAAYFEEGIIAPRSLPEAHYWRQRAAN